MILTRRWGLANKHTFSIKPIKEIVDNDIIFCWHCGQRMEIGKG